MDLKNKKYKKKKKTTPRIIVIKSLKAIHKRNLKAARIEEKV